VFEHEPTRGEILLLADDALGEPDPGLRQRLEHRLVADLERVANPLERLSVLDDVLFATRCTVLAEKRRLRASPEHAPAVRRGLSKARALIRIVRAYRRTLIASLRQGLGSRPDPERRLDPDAVERALDRSRTNQQMDALLLREELRDRPPLAGAGRRRTRSG
jgi:hypothetical protein